MMKLFLKLYFQKSVNALLAVRRMSLSPLFGSKRRRSMDPSILSAASESEEDQHNEADRKVSAPIDPSGLTLPNRRVGETRNSCFNLDMATIKALQEKAVKATGKASQSDENDNEDGESGTVESIESLELSATCSEEQENEGNTVERDNSVNEEISTLPRRRAHTFCGATFKATPAAASRERKISQISINVGNSSKNDFKPVSFTFNTEDMKRNERVILESAAILNARPKVQAFQQDFTTNDGSVKAGNSMDVSVLTTPGGQFDKSSLKPQTITLEMDNSILTEGLTEPPDNKVDQLPTICVNDELYVSDPPPIKLALNNNIEKKDQERRASTPPPSLKTNSTVSIANVDKIADSVQAITVQLGNLNGLQLNSKEVTCSVRRASTGSAPC